jgi:predicted metalloprotease
MKQRSTCRRKRPRQTLIETRTPYFPVLCPAAQHHVQNLVGTLRRAQELQQQIEQWQANQLQVRVELQADCFAGLWANRAQVPDFVSDDISLGELAGFTLATS